MMSFVYNKVVWKVKWIFRYKERFSLLLQRNKILTVAKNVTRCNKHENLNLLFQVFYVYNSSSISSLQNIFLHICRYIYINMTAMYFCLFTSSEF